ncbi:DUF4412 domain-containing protein [Cytophaga aurantiaca]|uniref:DUF4412 domain-containing protein n=1 Tax=Cytophaga aurantiaca TaxID=29530 RepID=UPI0012FB1685|nr:DUF4412 domain-containing protein [Cytophaga aurantiaca]
MKKIIVFIFCATLALMSQAQVNFEGTVKWGITLGGSQAAPAQKELTPQQKEELNKGIAELEAKMNDPEMKTMLDGNPSMKAMFEQQLATMKAMQSNGAAGAAAGAMPKSYTVKLKDGNSYTQVEGGALAAAGDILYLKSTDKTYYIKKAAKTYSVAPKSKAPASTDNAAVTVTATTETAKILTYTCTKYIVTFTEAGKTKTMFIWATKDLKKYSSSSFHTGGVGNQSHASASAFSKIDGVPLKIEVTEQGQTVVLQVLELKSATLSASDFVLPTGFKEVPFGQ